MYRHLLTKLRRDYDYKPMKIPRLLIALVQPVSGRLWQEHIFLDKAVGEFWVLQLMLVMVVTTDDSKLKKTLLNIAKDEVQHIHFGETQTLQYTRQNRFYRYYLSGLYLRNDFAMQLLYRAIRLRFRKRKRKDLEELATIFFSSSRQRLHEQAARVLLVQPHMLNTFQKIFRIILSQGLFFLRMIFFGWRRSPSSV